MDKFKIEISDLRSLYNAEYNSSIYTCPECGAYVEEVNAEFNSPNVIGFNYFRNRPAIIIRCSHCFFKYYHHIDKRSYDLYKWIQKDHKEKGID
jgi:hypothetical protein